MREIKFRGKTGYGDWIYGWFSKAQVGELMMPCIRRYREWDTGDYVESIAILPETVGEFTGLLDVDGKEIYEGDRLYNFVNETEGVVVYDLGRCYFCVVDEPDELNGDMLNVPGEGWMQHEIRVVGNIHNF